jgi:hypothetical protein
VTVLRPLTSLPRPKAYTLPEGKTLIRFYNPVRQEWNTGRRYGPMRDQRFDHHPLPEGDHEIESVWYAAGSLIGAVAESFGRLKVIDKNCGRRICKVALSAPFNVVDFYGPGPRYLGLDQHICTTDHYEETQELARALYLQFVDLVGIRWRGRQVSSENVIFTDRADLAKLTLISDHDISDALVWTRIANAARKCRIRVV